MIQPGATGFSNCSTGSIRRGDSFTRSISDRPNQFPPVQGSGDCDRVPGQGCLVFVTVTGQRSAANRFCRCRVDLVETVVDRFAIDQGCQFGAVGFSTGRDLSGVRGRINQGGGYHDAGSVFRGSGMTGGTFPRSGFRGCVGHRPDTGNMIDGLPPVN